MSLQVDSPVPSSGFAPSKFSTALDAGAELPGQWWLVWALMLLAMLGAVDRQVLSLLTNPIKADLNLSDTQISLIYGAAFALSNIAFTLPAGWLADRTNRKRLVAVGAGVWSVMSVACGLVGGFGQLFLTRAGVGFGESVIQPCSVSLIRQAVAPNRRARAFSIFGMSNLIGSGLALILGGALIGIFTHANIRSLPLIGQTRPWRLVMIVMGLVGLPLALLALTVREPAHAAQPEEGIRYADALSYMRKQWRVFTPLLVFQTTFTMLGLAYGAWLAAMVGRNYGLSLQQVGLTLGPIMLIAPAAGLWIAGAVVDRRTQTHGRTAPVAVGVVCTILVTILAVASPLQPTFSLFIPVIILHMFVGSTGYPIMTTVTSMATPSRNLGKVIAVLYASSNLVAAVLGPTLVALASDHLFHGPRALASALAWVTGGYGVVATLSLLVLLRTLKVAEVDDR